MKSFQAMPFELNNLVAAPFDTGAWMLSLLSLVIFAILGWMLSLKLKDVSIVDSMWSLMFMLSLLVYVLTADSLGWRVGLLFVMVSIWALRLSLYITLRNHGKGEDARYQAIRKNNQPNFEFKSLYIVFGLQALLAWLISLPLLAAASGQTPLGLLDVAAVALWLLGMFFEVLGDAQLARFKSDPANAGEVLNTGLWRYTRHPNYFGECTLWWGYFLLALSAGAAWTIVAPALMTFLLLRVSGVSLLEKDISKRRPEYQQYIRNTNAFLPGPSRRNGNS
jgi:steroid 5-alpha reductase family enzyme